jgi:GTP cyclohydrolase II
MGDVSNREAVLARIHSECLTGDGLFSQRCDCGPQLEAAMKRIAAEGRGVLLYLRQEGRGVGLINKIRAYALQEAGADTVEANRQLGFPDDSRTYDICKTMLDHLGARSLRVMTNNPAKLEALTRLGIDIAERLPLQVGRNRHNARYLATKADRMGHLL